MQLAEALDENPDPNVVEIHLTSQIALVEIDSEHRVQAWTYNGVIPGPLIRAKVGNHLIVHFKNELPKPTTVHWHGVQVPIQMDGVPDASQPEINPGESFTYDFIVSDASLFWYHPHVMSAAQVGFGLYGPLLVEDPADGVHVDSQQILVLSDIDVTEDGALGDPDTGGTTGMAFGREGNVLLVNGRVKPHLDVTPGAVQRWRLVNAAKSRYFELDLGADQKLLKIGGDGGLQEYPVEISSIVLAPGERADVLIRPDGISGGVVPVMSELFDRGYGSTEARRPEELFTIVLAKDRVLTPTTWPTLSRRIEPLSADGADPVEVVFDVSQEAGTKKFLYTINGQPLGKFRPIKAFVGQTQVWTITNPSPWSHPFHLHGFFFQVLDSAEQPVHPLQWKDTVDVPYKTKVRLLVRYDDRPGMWMFHCHILDHAEGGLMGSVQLVRPGELKGDIPVHVH